MGERKFSIKNDIVFKAVFGREDPICKMILTDLLNAILDLKGNQKIEELIYKNPFNLQSTITDKLSIMDIKVKTGTSEWIDIEMQVCETPEYRKRSLFYWASLYRDSLKNAQMFINLKKCIVINITSYNSIPESKDYHCCFQAIEKKQKFLLSDDLEIHFIDLTLFDDTKLVDEMSDIEDWITFFKDDDIEAKQSLVAEILERKESIKMAKKVLEEISADEHMREKIASIENFQMDQRARVYLAHQEGIVLGKAEGIYEEKIALAKAALLEGASVEFVSKVTNLDLQTLKKLQEEVLS